MDSKTDADSVSRTLSGWQLKLVAVTALAWSIFQLWYASPLPFILGFGVLIDVPARALHLGFALFLVFLIYPASRKTKEKRFGFFSCVLAALGCLCTFYLFLDYEGLVDRNGILQKHEIEIGNSKFSIPTELLIGLVGISLLLEATRRSIGLPLVIVATIFYLYSFFGQSMPDLISHQGLSLKRLVGYHWFGGEAIFGIPISVSVSFVFLFVLFVLVL